MKPILLLNEDAETADLVLKKRGIAVPESGVRAGYNCDRWGRVVLDVSTAKKQTKPALRFYHQSNKEINKMEYLLA